MALVAAVIAALLGGLLVAAPASASNDEYFDGQWALSQIGAPAAWRASTGAGIIIGIVDTGADLGHPDLAGKIVATADCIGRRPCRSAAGQDNTLAQDDNGHGTIVSGIAAAVTDNGIGIAGAAPDARLVVAKALDASGAGIADDIGAAIDWVVSRGARVVNLSVGEDQAVLGGESGGRSLRTAIDAAWARGAVPVLAAGNEAASGGVLASHNYGDMNALVVGATTRNGSVASYSSGIGTAKWGLVAPGGGGKGAGPTDNIYATGLRTSSAYVAAAGTSMAVPHVSAAVALLLAQGLGPAQAVNRLLGTLDRVPCGQGCQGRLNLAAATGSAAVRTPDPVVEPDRVPVRPQPARAAQPATSTTSRPPVTVPGFRELPFSEPEPGAEPPPVPVAGPRTASGPVALGPSAAAAAASGPGFKLLAGTLLMANGTTLTAVCRSRGRYRRRRMVTTLP